ncbi:MAG: amidase family protein [Gammaproteobacteria bacterium]
MTYQSPDKLEVIELARSLNWSIDDKQADLLTQYLSPFADGYQWLDSVSDNAHGGDFSGRSYETPSDNPHNAWYVHTHIPTTTMGPLAGKKIAVKDHIFVAGVPLSNGAGFLKDFIADFDAITVTRVIDAGGNVVGKSNCEYFCLSGGSTTCAHGPVDNPRLAGYSTAGSSSGSAALVAAGYVDMALGTDQGGSVRSPASWTGICGMKATRGTVPYNGGTVIESTIDYIGPMTQRVEDNALLLDVIADPRPGSFQDRLGEPLEGLRVGILDEGFNHPLSDTTVDNCVLESAKQFSQLGATVSKVSIPMHLNGLSIWGAVVTDGFWQSLKLRGLGYNYEGNYSQGWFHAMEDWQQHLAEMPINAQVLILLGKHLDQYEGRYYGLAKNFVEQLKSAYDQVLQEVDVLMMPTTVQQAGPNPDPQDVEGIFAHAFNNTINTAQFNASGHPAISIPCAVRNELPVGMMLVGRYMEEATLYQLAHAFEQAIDWQQA